MVVRVARAGDLGVGLLLSSSATSGMLSRDAVILQIGGDEGGEDRNTPDYCYD